MSRPFPSIARLLPAVLIVACSAPLRRPVDPVPPRARTVDVLHYDFALDLDLGAGHVQGTASVAFQALDQPVEQLVLDAVDLAVHAVHDDRGRELVHSVGPETLTIFLADPLPPGRTAAVVVDYDAFPRRGLTFVGPSTVDPERPWHAWSQGQAQDNRHWLPVVEQLDEQATHSMAVTVDEEFLTVAAGERVESIPHPARGRRTDVWRCETPHVAYLITLVAGDLERVALDAASPSAVAGDTGRPDVPLPVIARARDAQRALHATRHTAAMLDVFADFTGVDYPYARYAQSFVDDFTAGGMENISATTMYDEGLHDPDDEPQRDITGLVAHELAHQWFGDLFTCEDWAHLWINEGWADYGELLFERQLHGAGAEEIMRLGYQEGGCRAELDSSRPLVWFDYTHPDETFDGHAYNGGAARIHQLERLLGEDVFRRCVHAWVAWAAGRTVDTDDLQRVFEQTSGRDLDTFFEQWFHDVGFPILEGHVVAATRADAPPTHGYDVERLVITQTQAGRHGWRDAFVLGCDVTWSRGGVEHSAELTLETRRHELPLVGDGPLDWVRLDSGCDVPGQVLMEQDQGAWLAMLRGASRPSARWAAARWLAGDRWFAGDGELARLEDHTVDGLLAALADEPDGALRQAVVWALAGSGASDIGPELLAACEDGDPRVREAALFAVRPYLDDLPLAQDVVTAALRDGNDSVAAAAAAALVATGASDAFSRLSLQLERRHEVRLQRDLVGLLAGLDDAGVLPLLVGVATRHPERWVRVAAVEGLGRQDDRHHEEVHRQLCRALRDESYQVRAAAARVLGERGEVRAVPHLLAAWELEADLTALDAMEQALEAL